MKIGIIIYAFALAGDLDRLLRRILDESSASIYLFLHSQIPLVVTTCEMAAAMSDRVHYYPYGVNRGLGRSANEGFMDGYLRDGMDVMLTCNDDLLPARHDIEAIALAASENRDKYLINGMGITGGRREASDISLAALNPIAFQTIGYFDVNFFPAYYEDVDYRRRARLAGLEEFTVMDTEIVHQGSGSLPHVDKSQHDRLFAANRDYYIRKWGGEMGAETFGVPFNNPAFNLQICPEAILNPYPGYNREDLPR